MSAACVSRHDLTKLVLLNAKTLCTQLTGQNRNRCPEFIKPQKSLQLETTRYWKYLVVHTDKQKMSSVRCQLGQSTMKWVKWQAEHTVVVTSPSDVVCESSRDTASSWFTRLPTCSCVRLDRYCCSSSANRSSSSNNSSKHDSMKASSHSSNIHWHTHMHIRHIYRFLSGCKESENRTSQPP